MSALLCRRSYVCALMSALLCLRSYVGALMSALFCRRPFVGKLVRSYVCALMSVLLCLRSYVGALLSGALLTGCPYIHIPVLSNLFDSAGHERNNQVADRTCKPKSND